MGAAKLFLLYTDNHTDLLDRIPFSLPGYMLMKAHAFRRLNDRNNFIAARWLLHEFLTDIHPGFRFEDMRYTESGKPYVPGSQNFSIAHTSGLVGLAASAAPVGLDIERTRDIGSIRDFAQLFREEELTTMEQGGNASFFTSWTRKEAILKLTGDGIVDDEMVSSIVIEEGGQARYQGIRYTLQSFIAGGLYHITLAQPGDENATALSEYHVGTIEKNELTFAATAIK